MADLTSRKARIEEEQLPRLERIVEQAEAALAFLLSQHNTLHGAFLAAAASTPSPSASTHPVQTDPPTTNVSPQVAHPQHSLPSWPVHPPPFPVARPPPLGLAAKDLLTDIESGWAQMLQAALADAKVACSCACAASHHAAQHRITPHHTAPHYAHRAAPSQRTAPRRTTPHHTAPHHTAALRRTAPRRASPAHRRRVACMGSRGALAHDPHVISTPWSKLAGGTREPPKNRPRPQGAARLEGWHLSVPRGQPTACHCHLWHRAGRYLSPARYR